MVTVLPSLAAIEPRSRVTGLCAMAEATAVKARAAATKPASRRMGVIGILPKHDALWHESRQATVYDCVMRECANGLRAAVSLHADCAGQGALDPSGFGIAN